MAGHSAYQAKIGYGSTPTFIGGVTSVSTPSSGREEIDVTAHDSASEYREYIPSFKEAGEITIEFNFLHGDTGQEALYTMFENGTIEDWVIQWPLAQGQTTAATDEFEAFLSQRPVIDLPMDDAARGSVTLRVTGPVTFTPAS